MVLDTREKQNTFQTHLYKYSNDTQISKSEIAADFSSLGIRHLNFDFYFL